MMAALPAQATVTVYTDKTSFLTAAVNPASDTFDDLLRFAGYGKTLTRSAGGYTYTATADFFLFGASLGSPIDKWLQGASSIITLNGFSPGISSFAGNFFNDDGSDTFLPGGDIRIVVTDSTGSFTQLITNATVDGFFGFVSDGIISQITVKSIAGSTGILGEPAINNLTLGAIRAVDSVPEPAAWAMLLTGFGMLGCAGRARRGSEQTVRA